MNSPVDSEERVWWKRTRDLRFAQAGSECRLLQRWTDMQGLCQKANRDIRIARERCRCADKKRRIRRNSWQSGQDENFPASLGFQFRARSVDQALWGNRGLSRKTLASWPPARPANRGRGLSPAGMNLGAIDKAAPKVAILAICGNMYPHRGEKGLHCPPFFRGLPDIVSSPEREK